METAPKLSPLDTSQADSTSAVQNDPAFATNRSYARELRVVGQMLESRDVATADLVFVAGAYNVQGQLKAASRSSLLSILRDWTKVSGSRGGSRSRNLAGETIKLRRTLEDISEFDFRACSLRREANRMPDPHGLSQILRSAGAYLDTRKGSSLIGIMLRERDMTIRFETASKRLEEMRQDVEYFYDYWVKMYLRRNKRSHVDPSKDIFPASVQDASRRGSR